MRPRPKVWFRVGWFELAQLGCMLIAIAFHLFVSNRAVRLGVAIGLLVVLSLLSFPTWKRRTK